MTVTTMIRMMKTPTVAQASMNLITGPESLSGLIVMALVDVFDMQLL